MTAAFDAAFFLLVPLKAGLFEPTFYEAEDRLDNVSNLSHNYDI